MRTWQYLCTNTVHLGCSTPFRHTVLFTCAQCAISLRTVQLICIKCSLYELGATYVLTMLRNAHVRTKQFT